MNRIWPVIPHCYNDESINLLDAYNRYFNLIEDNDWLLILDHDIFFTHKNWYRECEIAIKKYPTAGAFTCKCNVYYDTPSKKESRYNRVELPPMDSINEVKEAALDWYNKHKGKFSKWQGKLTGYFMLIKKEVWTHIISELQGHSKRRFIRVDHTIGRCLTKHGYVIYCLDGIFVSHYKLRKRINVESN